MGPRILVAWLLGLFLCAHVSAETSKPVKKPTQMTEADAARLDAAELRAREAQRVYVAAQQDFFAKVLEVNKLLRRYQIDPAEYGKSARVDFATGKITRDPPAPAPEKKGPTK